MNEKEAREIRQAWEVPGPTEVTILNYREAKGYLESLEKASYLYDGMLWVARYFKEVEPNEGMAKFCENKCKEWEAGR